jgi:hypothetical protein
VPASLKAEDVPFPAKCQSASDQSTLICILSRQKGMSQLILSKEFSAMLAETGFCQLHFESH